jgi:pyrimidine-nucleoside phosphorylase
LPQAPVVQDMDSPQGGYVSQLDAMVVGLTALDLGAGRVRKSDSVDHAVGVVLHKKVGDGVLEGEPLCTVHARSDEDVQRARATLLKAYEWADLPVQPPPLLYQVVR